MAGYSISKTMLSSMFCNAVPSRSSLCFNRTTRASRVCFASSPKYDSAKHFPQEHNDVDHKLKHGIDVTEEKADMAGQRAEEMKDRTKEKASELSDKAGQRAEEMKDRTKEKASELSDKAGQRAEEMKDNLRNAANSASQKVKEGGEEAKEKAAGVVHDAKEKVSETVGKMGEMAKEKVKDAWDATKETTQKLKDSVVGTSSESESDEDDLTKQTKRVANQGEKTINH